MARSLAVINTHLEAPSIDRPIETLKLGMRKILWAYNRRKQVLVYDLPASPMRLPCNDVSVLRVANDVVQFGWEVRLDGSLSVTVIVLGRHFHLRIIPVGVVNHRLLYLDLLPFPGRVIVVWIHHVGSLGSAKDRKYVMCLIAAPNPNENKRQNSMDWLSRRVKLFQCVALLLLSMLCSINESFRPQSTATSV